MKKIKIYTGEYVTPVAEFNDGCSHIIVDDGCYIIVNGEKFSPWIFREALAVLKTLPENPKDIEIELAKTEGKE